ncbi:putative gustatory receptor 28b [Folsomia candida]|nr:putative gustatory receptor 28b [Folsomia candida]
MGVPLILRLIQFLGYFPIPLSSTSCIPKTKVINENESELITKNFKSNFTSSKSLRFLSQSCLIILGSLYTLLLLCVVCIFFLKFNYWVIAVPGFWGKGRGIFYSAVILKALSHILCCVVVKLDMIYRRGRLRKFYNSFLSMIDSVGEATGGCEASLKTNRYQKRLSISTYLFLVLITVWSIELFLTLHGREGACFSYTFAYVTPPIMGYYHSLFPFLAVFFLNWYLESLKRISSVVTNKLRYMQSVEIDKCTKNSKNESSWYFHHNNFNLSNRMETPQSISRDSEMLVNIYNVVRQQSLQFNRTFGFWISLDMAHSLLRIVFSAYFIVSLMCQPISALRSIVQNILTVIVYFYLLYMMCKKGSDIAGESEKVVEALESLMSLENGQDIHGRLKRIKIETNFFNVDLKIITPILGTVTTYLLVLIQFQTGDCKSGRN